jgi:hypothetical protein
MFRLIEPIPAEPKLETVNDLPLSNSVRPELVEG